MGSYGHVIYDAVHALVEGHHEACDGHIHRHLTGHAAYEHHLLTSVRMVRGVVELFRLP